MNTRYTVTHLAGFKGHCQMVRKTFKFPDHQVAGHQARMGRLGPLIDESGHFYKPLQRGERGSREAAFYESLHSCPRVPKEILRFIPEFCGTQRIEASDGSGLHPHLVLKDVVASYDKPCIMDIKIGSRTWYPQASKDYVQKCLGKDRNTTSVSLGFRISGLQFYQKESGYWKPDQDKVANFTVDEARSVLRQFVSSYHSADSDQDPDCAFACDVYGGLSGILPQLLELKSWFEDQTQFHFYSSSILIFYDKELAMKGGNSGASVKLIDFAHVFEGNGVIDHNFLGGLCSLIKWISETLSTSNGSIALLQNGI